MIKFFVLGLTLMEGLLTACSRHPSDPDVEKLVKPGQETVLTSALAPEESHQLDDLIVFGDSISDTGRLHRRTLGIYAPSDVYWRGRLTNGPNWSDYVCGALHCRSQNYAVAGAATRLKTIPLRWVLRPLDAQVEEFLHDTPLPPPDRSVAVIWIGANNYFEQKEIRADEVRDDIRESATELLKGPVQRLLIGTMPQIANILQPPDQQTPIPREDYRRATALHNTNIRSLIQDLHREFPKKSIALYDAYEINQATIDRPLDFGFTSLTEPCYRGDYRGRFHGERRFCPDYLCFKFWDYTHSNSRMHCFYAARFLLDLHEAGWLEHVDADKAIATCKQL